MYTWFKSSVTAVLIFTCADKVESMAGGLALKETFYLSIIRNSFLTVYSVYQFPSFCLAKTAFILSLWKIDE